MPAMLLHASMRGRSVAKPALTARISHLSKGRADEKPESGIVAVADSSSFVRRDTRPPDNGIVSPDFLRNFLRFLQIDTGVMERHV
jgi:hypothetical protein